VAAHAFRLGDQPPEQPMKISARNVLSGKVIAIVRAPDFSV
jgi:hypothetical protein